MGSGIVINQKDISTPKTPGREFIIDDGIHLMKNKVYYSRGHVYQVIFGGPKLNGMSAELVQFYDALALKFFSSFKIGS